MRRTALIFTALALLATAAPASATFPGRNGLVAYGAEDGVHVMRPDGTRDRIVSRKAPASGAVFGPHGNRIAFSSRGRIYMVDLGTGKTQSLTAYGSDTNPTWSSQGGRIAFIRRTDDAYEAWYVRLSDRLKDRLPIMGDTYDVEWAPDGSSLAYSGRDGDVHIAKPSGRNARTLVDFPEGEGQPLAGSLSWAPDASELAIVTESNSGACEQCELLWTVNSDGSDLHQVTSHIRGIHSPFYAPDGQSLAFCRYGWNSADTAIVDSQQAAVHHGQHYVGPTCGESWQARA